MTAVMRNIPRIKHTPELEAAAIAVAKAVDGKGLAVALANPLDVRAVKATMTSIADWFKDPSFFFEGEANGELAAVENLILLATLYREHLKAGNTGKEES